MENVIGNISKSDQQFFNEANKTNNGNNDPGNNAY